MGCSLVPWESFVHLGNQTVQSIVGDASRVVDPTNRAGVNRPHVEASILGDNERRTAMTGIRVTSVGHSTPPPLGVEFRFAEDVALFRIQKDMSVQAVGRDGIVSFGTARIGGIPNGVTLFLNRTNRTRHHTEVSGEFAKRSVHHAPRHVVANSLCAIDCWSPVFHPVEVRDLGRFSDLGFCVAPRSIGKCPTESGATTPGDGVLGWSVFLLPTASPYPIEEHNPPPLTHFCAHDSLR